MFLMPIGFGSPHYSGVCLELDVEAHNYTLVCHYHTYANTAVSYGALMMNGNKVKS
jgi:hypothetical protein